MGVCLFPCPVLKVEFAKREENGPVGFRAAVLGWEGGRR